MKIAFVITGLGVGGAENVVVSLADRLSDRGHQVLLIYLAGGAEIVPKSDVKIFYAGLESFFCLPRAFLRIRNLLSEFSPDVVNTHLVHANILVRLMRIFMPLKRLISSAHNSNEEGRFRMLAYRLTNSLSDVSTNVSDEAVSFFERCKAVPEGKMLTMHNGINTDKFARRPEDSDFVRESLGVSDNELLIVAVGRFCEAKDYPNLLKALSILGSDRVLKWRLLIAGDGPLRNQMEKMAEGLALTDCVSFLGVRNDIPELLSASDIFVLSSAWEGFPMVVGEAMASECLVVATNCGGVAEFLGDTGILVNPGDPRALADGLRCAMAMTSEDRKIEGKKERERVKARYSLDSTVDKWLEVYKGAAP